MRHFETMYSPLRLCLYLLGYVLLWLHTFEFCAISQKKLATETNRGGRDRSTYLPQLDKGELVTYLKDKDLAEVVTSVYTGMSLFSDAVLVFGAICRSIFALNAVVVYWTASLVADSLTNFVAYREVKRYCLINDLKVRKPRDLSVNPLKTAEVQDISTNKAVQRAESIKESNIVPVDNSNIVHLSNGSFVGGGGSLTKSVVISSAKHVTKLNELSNQSNNSNSLFRSIRIEEIGVNGCDYIIVDYTFPLPLAFVFWRTICILSKVILIGMILCLAKRFRQENILLMATEIFRRQKLMENARRPVTA